MRDGGQSEGRSDRGTAVSQNRVSERPAPSLLGAVTPEKHSINVLLVDDDEDDYVLTRDMLAEVPGKDYVLRWVSNCRDALEQLTGARAYDVCLVDYRLGVENGLDLVREAVRRGARTPLIMLTGQDDHAVDLAALEAGAADYLTKGQVSSSLLERAIRYAIERARALETLRELAIRDELTGLFNRREMIRALREEMARSRRYRAPMALVLLDIDHFKKVNDTFGHQAGDDVLRWLADLLRENLRAVDLPARFGGEEIAIVLPEVTADRALEMAERLREVVARQGCMVTDLAGHQAPIPITISLGVAGLTPEVTREDELISRADQALYDAKGRGRNRAVSYGG
jgi:diguanylate cyclase (GGDEF)-like protein